MPMRSHLKFAAIRSMHVAFAGGSVQSRKSVERRVNLPVADHRGSMVKGLFLYEED